MKMKCFNEEKEINDIINYIKNYYKKNNITGVIIGISGGKDSAIVAALFCKAIGSNNVIGVSLPCYSKKTDQEDAKLISDYYNFKLINYNLESIYDNYLNVLELDSKYCVNSNINLKPRIRTSFLYYLAAYYTSLYNKTYIVAGTTNKCEKYVGYFTKGADNVADIFPIMDYTVSEVIKLGKYLNVPKKVLFKEPSDGLSEFTDEEKLGIKYSDIEKYLINKNGVSFDIRNKIRYLHKINNHKNIMNYYRRKK